MQVENIEFIAIKELQFDPKNPRIPLKLGNRSEKKIIEWMFLDAGLEDLMYSIGRNGFFRGEPLLVTKKGGKYVVIEGNRRLAASKLLNNPQLSKVKAKTIKAIVESCPKSNIPTHLPVIVYSDRSKVLNYLGYRHVTGIKSWGPFAKARYLNELFKNLNSKENLDEKCKELALTIGNQKAFTKRLLVGFWLFEILEENGFFKIPDLDEESIAFSHLYDSLRFDGIVKFLNVNLETSRPIDKLQQNHFKEFCKWLYYRQEGQTRLGDSRNLRILNKVVLSKEALQAFRTGVTLEDASHYAGYPDEVLTKHITSALSAMKNAADVATRAKNLGGVNEENLRSINKYVRMIINSFDDKLS